MQHLTRISHQAAGSFANNHCYLFGFLKMARMVPRCEVCCPIRRQTRLKRAGALTRRRVLRLKASARTWKDMRARKRRQVSTPARLSAISGLAVWPRALSWLLAAGALASCAQPDDAPPTQEAPTQAPTPTTAIASNPNRNAYFGDLHVHTMYSMDAFIFGARATPDDAYRFAKGDSLAHAAGFEMRLDKPLDFQAVTDHAVYLGMGPAMADPASAVGTHPYSMALRDAKTVHQKTAYFTDSLAALLRSPEGRDLLNLDIVKDAWRNIIESSERHNDPGVFTTFIGYEYTTSGPAGANLHRNVIFRNSDVPDIPFSLVDSPNPEDLWAWMDGLRALGIESLAIPHNSNRSNGMMFQNTYLSGQPIDAVYANQRMANEPLVEITQVKGTSDTHPMLSPNDEWADFEISNQRAGSPLPSTPQGSYVRDAYLNGLAMREKSGINPYRFGLIGSSDTHNAAGSFREDNHWSKLGLADATPQLRGSVPPDDTPEDGAPAIPDHSGKWSASGLAGAWAESNTRTAIYDAFRRKETFATSGPRIRVRFFGGPDIDQSLLDSGDIIGDAYAKGVPMGTDLMIAGDSAPSFFLWALRDPHTVPLQRLQVIKGWVENGQTFEQVYDVACSDGGRVHPETHRCPDNGAAVDIAACAVSPDKGATELSAVWTDPAFKAGQPAFYYARVLENPKCRWSTWDAIRAGVAPNPDMPASIQDRAWSSPIWVRMR